MPKKSFVLPDSLESDLESRAENEGVPEAQVIREALKEYLNDDLPELQEHEQQIEHLESELSTVKTALIKSSQRDYHKDNPGDWLDSDE